MSTNTHHDWQPASQCHAGEASTGSKPNSKSVPNGTTTPAYYSESQPSEVEMPLQVVTGERSSGQLEPENRDLKDLAAVKRKLQGPEASTENSLSHHQSGEIIMRSQQELQKILDLLAGHRPTVNLSNLKLFVNLKAYILPAPLPQDRDDISTIPSSIEARRGQNGFLRVHRALKEFIQKIRRRFRRQAAVSYNSCFEADPSPQDPGSNSP